MKNYNSDNMSIFITKQSCHATVNNSEKCNIDLMCFKICDSLNNKPHEKRCFNAMHSHPLYEFYMVLDGQMDISLEDGSTVSVEKNFFIIIPPSVKYVITKETQNIKKITMSFDINASGSNNEFYLSAIKCMNNIVPRKVSVRMTKLFSFMSDIKKTNLYDKKAMIFELAVCYIIELCNVVTGNYNVNKAEFLVDKRVETAVRYIKENVSLPITSADVAKYVHISVRQLSRIFKDHLGQSIAEYIKMEKNKCIYKLITETNLGLSDIAEAVGFPDATFLVKRFKSLEGITPAKYRSTLKKE